MADDVRASSPARAGADRISRALYEAFGFTAVSDLEWSHYQRFVAALDALRGPTPAGSPAAGEPTREPSDLPGNWQLAFDCMERILMHADRQERAGIPREAQVFDYTGIYRKAYQRALRAVSPPAPAPSSFSHEPPTQNERRPVEGDPVLLFAAWVAEWDDADRKPALTEQQRGGLAAWLVGKGAAVSPPAPAPAPTLECYMCDRGIPTERIDGKLYHVEPLAGKRARADGSFPMGKLMCMKERTLYPAGGDPTPSDRLPPLSLTEQERIIANAGEPGRCPGCGDVWENDQEHPRWHNCNVTKRGHALRGAPAPSVQQQAVIVTKEPELSRSGAPAPTLHPKCAEGGCLHQRMEDGLAKMTAKPTQADMEYQVGAPAGGDPTPRQGSRDGAVYATVAAQAVQEAIATAERLPTRLNLVAIAGCAHWAALRGAPAGAAGEPRGEIVALQAALTALEMSPPCGGPCDDEICRVRSYALERVRSILDDHVSGRLSDQAVIAAIAANVRRASPPGGATTPEGADHV